MWKTVFIVLAVALAPACATGDGSIGAAAGDALGADLFPFEDRELRFVTDDGDPREVRVETAPDAASAKLWIHAASAQPVRMDIRRQGEAIYFSAGAGLGTDLLRLGERPGASWRVGRKTVHFDGWDRVDTPAGTFEAARITTSRGPENFQERETWWFARGEGIVRLRTNNAGIWENEMWRTQ